MWCLRDTEKEGGGEENSSFRETIARHYVNFWGFIIKLEGGGKRELQESGKKCADLQNFAKRGVCVYRNIN